MEQVLSEMFEQARKLVVETDRRLAEENDRLREKEREARLLELSTQIEAAFDLPARKSSNSIRGWMCRTENRQWSLSCAACGRFSSCRRSLKGVGS